MSPLEPWWCRLPEIINSIDLEKDAICLAWVHHVPQRALLLDPAGHPYSHRARRSEGKSRSAMTRTVERASRYLLDGVGAWFSCK